MKPSAIFSQDEIPSVIVLFLALTAGLSLIMDYFCIYMGMRRHYVAGLMWTPALATFLTLKLKGRRIRDLDWGWGDAKWHGLAYAMPIAYGLIAYGLLWGVGLGDAPDPRFIKELSKYLALYNWSDTAVLMFGVAVLGSFGMLWHYITSFGEEVGWRGLLTPLLMRKMGFLGTSVSVGLVWAVWSAPIIFFPDYNAGPRDLGIQFVNYTLVSVGVSMVQTYIRLKAGSLWPSVMLHAAHNVYILSILEPVTIEFEHTWRYAHEFGFILPVVTLMVGLLFWRRAAAEGLGDRIRL